MIHIYFLPKVNWASAWEKGRIVNFSKIEVLAAQDAAYSNEKNEKNCLKIPIIDQDEKDLVSRTFIDLSLQVTLRSTSNYQNFVITAPIF